MHVCVIGLGYVGLPLAVEFAKAGLRVTGIDVDEDRVARFNAGDSYVLDVPSAALAEQVEKGPLSATTDFSVLNEADAVCICVPTPLTKTMAPDVSHILAAVVEVRKYLHPGMLVILESTTYPGTTDELLLPKLEESGLEVGKDFFMAFSPERVDPGNQEYRTRNTPKVIGGVTPQCTEKAVALYSRAIEEVVPVKSARIAEMVKLLENTFRAINIGLINEMAIICDHLDIDVWEVIDAAKTKPFGFMPFYPGPGLGGHCIPIDPLYLSWKLRSVNYAARFIDLATSINSNMPKFVSNQIGQALNGLKKSVNGSRILILGVAYKPNVSDVRTSPSLDVIEQLLALNADIAYADPYVPEVEVGGVTLRAYDLGQGVEAFDCVAILTAHDAFDIQEILNGASLVYDARNATANLDVPPTCRLIKL